ncbi:hypothetical protein P376_3293 [Streptomyces sp. HCCB10043]|nr:hypothetical protein P376_3293 [Streptomyces sp. HCCB10043]
MVLEYQPRRPEGNLGDRPVPGTRRNQRLCSGQRILSFRRNITGRGGKRTP